MIELITFNVIPYSVEWYFVMISFGLTIISVIEIVLMITQYILGRKVISLMTFTIWVTTCILTFKNQKEFLYICSSEEDKFPVLQCCFPSLIGLIPIFNILVLIVGIFIITGYIFELLVNFPKNLQEFLDRKRIQSLKRKEKSQDVCNNQLVNCYPRID